MGDKEIKKKETNFAGRTTWNFYSGGEKMRNAEEKKSVQEHNYLFTTLFGISTDTTLLAIYF